MQNLPSVVPQGQGLIPHVSTLSRHAALWAAFAWPRRSEANAKSGFILLVRWSPIVLREGDGDVSLGTHINLDIIIILRYADASIWVKQNIRGGECLL